MLNQRPSKLLLLLGDTNVDLKSFDIIVCFSSARADYLQQQGTRAFCFSSFSFNPEQGRLLDAQLIEDLEKCLEMESQENPVLKWAPLALQQLRTRLSYYFWLKECITNILRRFQPTEVFLSSEKNAEVVYAVQKTMPAELIINVLKGSADYPENVLHRSMTYDIPLRMDPGWFIRLRWLFICMIIGRGKVLYQWYWNIGQTLQPPRNHRFNQHRAVNFIESALKKLYRIITKSSPYDLYQNIFPEEKSEILLLTSSAWDVFEDDQKEIIGFTLKEFLQMYPVSYLDRMASHFGFIFELLKPTRLILNADQIGISRMLSFIAHQHNVFVDNLPHGIIWEYNCGRYKRSPFQPNQILVWNHSSGSSLEELGWKTKTIAHPRNLFRPKPYVPLTKDWRNLKVLILVSEWICVSLEGRGDIPYLSIVEAYKALIKLGVQPNHITIKCHLYLASGHANSKKELIDKLRSYFGMKFHLIDQPVDSMSIIPSYDLVIMGITSGIFEAVLQGVPMVIFAESLGRVGTLKRFSVPFSFDEEGFYQSIKNYDNLRMEQVYKEITQSIQSGELLH